MNVIDVDEYTLFGKDNTIFPTTLLPWISPFGENFRYFRYMAIMPLPVWTHTYMNRYDCKKTNIMDAYTRSLSIFSIQVLSRGLDNIFGSGSPKPVTTCRWSVDPEERQPGTLEESWRSLMDSKYLCFFLGPPLCFFFGSLASTRRNHKEPVWRGVKEHLSPVKTILFCKLSKSDEYIESPYIQSCHFQQLNWPIWIYSGHWILNPWIARLHPWCQCRCMSALARTVTTNLPDSASAMARSVSTSLPQIMDRIIIFPLRWPDGGYTGYTMVHRQKTQLSSLRLSGSPYLNLICFIHFYIIYVINF